MMTWKIAKALLELLKSFTQTKKKSIKIKANLNYGHLKLQRRWFTMKSTIGELYLNGKRECFTLEDPVHAGPKVYGETAIPSGEYEVIINYSPRYSRLMPRVKNVPGFKGILIHWGNYPKDTEGCILVGKTKRINYIGQSKKAFSELFSKLQKFDKMEIEIV